MPIYLDKERDRKNPNPPPPLFCSFLLTMIVVVVLGRLRDAMKTRNLDRSYQTGRVIKIMNHVQRTRRSDGAINAGATKGTKPPVPHISKLISGRHYSEADFHRRKFDLLEDQIMVWAEEFHVNKFEVWLPNRDHSPVSSSHKIIVDPVVARMYVLRWRQEWEQTHILPNIKIRPI
jgi:hypothetical protein